MKQDIVSDFLIEITKAMIRPSGATRICVSNTPTITGKTIKAPNALVLERRISSPPKSSANPTKGMSHSISIKAKLSFSIASGKSGGIGI